MKWGLILILCILFSFNYVSARDIVLDIGEDYTDGNVRITLARISRDYDKVVICVNNEKQIIYEDQFTYFKDASLEVEHIDRIDRNVEINIDWINSCTHCKCEGDCLNDRCDIQKYDEYGDLIKEEENTGTSLVENENITDLTIEKEEKPDYFLIINLVIIGSLLGLILVWLLWFRKMSF